ncbi:hypothetical protein Mal64_37490 [Pseudobythopirellula maris]|uniref:Uncharacterized protein n=2 Tax=Pseudobythopirellula maris TaxID=2527991 RepID=A0A5C5ZHM6_9BACT|nr:hypothetical protein Mal64_37490 [Pseudobythopirellula maris]
MFAYYPGQGAEVSFNDIDGNLLEAVPMSGAVGALDSTGGRVYGIAPTGAYNGIYEVQPGKPPKLLVEDEFILTIRTGLSASSTGVFATLPAGRAAVWFYEISESRRGVQTPLGFGIDLEFDGTNTLLLLTQDGLRRQEYVEDLSGDYEIVDDQLLIDLTTLGAPAPGATLALSNSRFIAIANGEDGDASLFDPTGAFQASFSLEGVIRAMAFGPHNSLYAVVSGNDGGLFELRQGAAARLVSDDPLYRNATMGAELVYVPEPMGFTVVAMAFCAISCSRLSRMR